ncbi:MAG: hypothetical protein HOO01_03470 [Cellvibrionales bacterium]|jgi:hypothetical protein|nr:hypothetical protein [Cellvibrionales bacterium]
MTPITIKRYRRLLLKALLLVFVMHTSIGYAACCITLDVTESQSSMPCHNDNQDSSQNSNLDSNQDTHIEHDECCSSCFAIAIPTNLTRNLSSTTENMTADAVILFISSNIDPLFRPPITHLS